MAAQATARTDPRLDSAPVLDFAHVRDEVLRAYQPATAEESLLALQIARAWFRLQKYYDFEAELIEKQKLSELFDTDLRRFKALSSAVATAERMWRQAIREFQAARRRAAKPSAPMAEHAASPRVAHSPAIPSPAHTTAEPTPAPPSRSFSRLTTRAAQSAPRIERDMPIAPHVE